MKISTGEILTALKERGLLVQTRGHIPATADNVADDSRKIQRNGLFVAVRGWNSDGHDFLEAAASNGAAVAIVEDAGRTELPAIVVKNGRLAAAIAAASAFQFPARNLTMVGVTGTNGKTTTTSIIRHLLDDGAGTSASIGTLGVLVGSAGEVVPGGSGLTTPGPVELQQLLRLLVDRGVKYVAMEASSHSLDQRRIDGIEFDAVVFTNLTRDHLDYHGTMEKYFQAKAKLLNYLKPSGTALINADAGEWSRLQRPARTITFGVRQPADVQARDVSFTTQGSHWRFTAKKMSAEVTLPLIGDVNVQNGTAAGATALALGRSVEEIAKRLGNVPQVPGRLEIIWSKPTVLRDYAHTPDALERSLRTSREFTRGKLIVVFGCGGDRDKGKRPLMGEIAEKGADIAIVTSDNPRTEDPDRIIDDVEAGMPGKNHQRITDRHEAIRHALEIGREGDIILLAGKGHETYQIRGTQSFPFDEKEIVAEMMGSHA